MNAPHITACTNGPDGTPCGNVPAPGEKFRTGHPQNGAHCFYCWRENVPAVPMPNRPPDTNTPCIHRGDVLTGLERERLISQGQTHVTHGRAWALCGCRGFAKEGKAVSGCLDHAGQFGCGFGCPEYELPEEAKPRKPEVNGKRHLAMHVYPSQGNNTWRRSLDQIRARWSLFTGEKVIASVTGNDLTPWEVVRDYCEGWGATVIPVPNVATLREVATWGVLWEAILPNAGPNDIAFYCHAKGTSRAVNPGNMVHRWSSLLWSLNLDWVPDVETMLKTYPIVGCFKKVGYGFGRSHGRWHYSGTFFWVRVKDFRESRYKLHPPNVWYGVEAWPGMAYDAGEAGTFYRETPVSKTNLYCPDRWKVDFQPEYAAWIAARRPHAERICDHSGTAGR